MPLRPPASLEIVSLSHRYRGAQVDALDDVTFRVKPGERVGLLGPNGAGKSTLMRIFCGFLAVQQRKERPPGTTRVEVGGIDVSTQSLKVRELVGYLPEQVPLYLELRVREHLEFRAAIKKIPFAERAAEIARVCGLTGLKDMLERPIGQLSRGYRQRVGLADALLGSPPLVVLDEPTVGLDPNQVLEIRAMLKGLGGAQTLIFSSHILAEVEALCDRVVILSRGRVVADESVAEAMHAHDVIAEWDAKPAQVEAVLAAVGADFQDIAHARKVFDAAPLRVEIPCEGAKVAEELCRALGRASLAQGVALCHLARGRRRLEERFARVTGAAEEVQ